MSYAPVLLLCTPELAFAVTRLQSGIASALSDSSRGLYVRFIDHSSAKAIHDLELALRKHAPIGAVLEAGLSCNDPVNETFEAVRVPYVRIAPDASDAASRLVCSNDRLGVSDATNFLISQGHKRFGYISISDDSPTARERELGFLDALSQHGLEFCADLVVPAEDSAKAAMEAALLLLAVSPRPTAILASSDIQAAGVLQAAGLNGIAVPADLSVMGFGDADLAAALTPPLTTMHIPYAEMGFTAAIKLLDPSRADMQPVEFFCKLVVRESTAPPA